MPALFYVRMYKIGNRFEREHKKKSRLGGLPSHSSRPHKGTGLKKTASWLGGKKYHMRKLIAQYNYISTPQDMVPKWGNRTNVLH